MWRWLLIWIMKCSSFPIPCLWCCHDETLHGQTRLYFTGYYTRFYPTTISLPIGPPSLARFTIPQILF